MPAEVWRNHGPFRERMTALSRASCGENPRSVPKMSFSSKDHRDAELVTRLNHFRVTLRAAWLNDGGNTGALQQIDIVAKREKRIRGENRPPNRSPGGDFCKAIPTESTRLIWPAPIPQCRAPLAMTIAFERTCLQTSQAKARSSLSAGGT